MSVQQPFDWNESEAMRKMAAVAVIPDLISSLYIYNQMWV